MDRVCHFLYGGVHCTRPVAHCLCKAWIIDGVYVEKELSYMCETCFTEFVKYARDKGNTSEAWMEL